MGKLTPRLQRFLEVPRQIDEDPADRNVYTHVNVTGLTFDTKPSIPNLYAKLGQNKVLCFPPYLQRVIEGSVAAERIAVAVDHVDTVKVAEIGVLCAVVAEDASQSGGGLPALR